jgi:hypothetical protein
VKFDPSLFPAAQIEQDEVRIPKKILKSGRQLAKEQIERFGPPLPVVMEMSDGTLAQLDGTPALGRASTGNEILRRMGRRGAEVEADGLTEAKQRQPK